MSSPGKEARLNLIDPIGGDVTLPSIGADSIEAGSSAIAWLPARVDQRLSFTVEAPSGDIPLEASDLPRHATFDPVERRFTWRPRLGQEGVWVITFTATDPEQAFPIAVRISVRAAQDSVVDLR